MYSLEMIIAINEREVAKRKAEKPKEPVLPKVKK